jgi:hypothetical protein
VTQIEPPAGGAGGPDDGPMWQEERRGGTTGAGMFLAWSRAAPSAVLVKALPPKVC